MIFVVKRCADCPFMSAVNGQQTCNIATPAHRPIDSQDGRPDWCGLRSGQKNVRDFPGPQGCLVATKCEECPFLSTVDGQRGCNVAIPRQRPIADDEERPFWCKMRKEQIIVRDFK